MNIGTLFFLEIRLESVKHSMLGVNSVFVARMVAEVTVHLFLVS